MTNKAKVIVSDLHLGAGLAPANPLEDFTVDPQFAALLAALRAESEADGREFELIVNGDMVEFLQTPALADFDPQAAYPPDDYAPSTEEASARKMALVIAGHPAVFAALRDWLSPGPPRRSITIIKGNHDVNLHWTAVQELVRQAVDAATERRPLLTFVEQAICREGLYVEHGNQHAEKVNRFKQFDEPHDPEDPAQLEIPVGSTFVIDFFNDAEREKWWLDSVKPLTALLWYCLAIDFRFAARMLVKLLGALPPLVWGSFARESEAETLQRQLSDEDEVAALAEQYAIDPDFRRHFNSRLTHLLAPLQPPQPATAMAVQPVDALQQAHQAAEGSDLALRQVAADKIAAGEARVVVFGHTHRALCERLDGGWHVNCGTWVWWRDFAGMGLDGWRDFTTHPENYTQPHYLTYARIDYDAQGRPTPRVLDFSGELHVDCAPLLPEEHGGCGALWARLVAWFKSIVAS